MSEQGYTEISPLFKIFTPLGQNEYGFVMAESDPVNKLFKIYSFDGQSEEDLENEEIQLFLKLLR